MFAHYYNCSAPNILVIILNFSIFILLLCIYTQTICDVSTVKSSEKDFPFVQYKVYNITNTLSV